MSNVIGIRGAAQDPNQVLEAAKGEYESVILIGWDLDGEMDARASLNLTSGQILWLVESFKLQLLSGQYDDEEG